MDLWQLLKALGKQRLVLVVGLLVTAMLPIVLGRGITPSWDAYAGVLLSGSKLTIDPKTGEKTRTGNPYAESLPVTAVAMSMVVQGDDVRGQIVEAGGSNLYTIITSQQNSIVEVQATGTSKAQASLTVQLVLNQFRKQLSAREQLAGVQADYRVRVESLNEQVTVIPIMSGLMRTRAALVVGGLLLTVMTALVLEGRRQRRSMHPVLASHALALVEAQKILREERLLLKQAKESLELAQREGALTGSALLLGDRGPFGDGHGPQAG